MLTDWIAHFITKRCYLVLVKSRQMDEKEKKERLKLQKRFGEHLIKLRKAEDITPAELARRCFMERSNIARLETGRTNPSLFVLKKLAAGLGVEMDELLQGFR